MFSSNAVQNKVYCLLVDKKPEFWLNSPTYQISCNASGLEQGWEHSLAISPVQKHAIKKQCMEDFYIVVLSESSQGSHLHTKVMKVIHTQYFAPEQRK